MTGNVWYYNRPYTYIEHHGILGQKWGIRRYQNEDGTLTPEGKARLEKYKSKQLARVKNDRYANMEKRLIKNMTYDQMVYEKRQAFLNTLKKVTSTAVPIGIAVATPVVGYNILVPWVAAKLSDPVVQQQMTNLGYQILNSDPVQQFMKQTVNTAIPVASRAAVRELLTNKEVQSIVVSSVKETITTEGTKAIGQLKTNPQIVDWATKGTGALATLRGVRTAGRAVSAKNKLDKYASIYKR